MAKKKEVQEQVEQLESPELVEMQEHTAEEAEGAKLEEVVLIPKTVENILKNYPQYEALYVDTQGGVYTSDTQPYLVETAILYKNPYYGK